MFGPTSQINTDSLLLPLQVEGRTREPEIEAQIRAMLRCTPAGFRYRACLEDRDCAEWVQPETLVGLIRILQRCGEMEAAWDLVPVLIDRSAAFINKKLRVWRLTAQQKEDCIHEIQHGMILELFNAKPGAEFWEVRFWLCLERRLTDITRRHQMRSDRETSADAPANDEIGETPVARLEDDRTLPAQILVEMQEALSLLTSAQRTAFVLYHQHQWSQPEIAGHLKVTDRTVRNLLNRAEERLAQWRGEILDTRY